MILSNQRGALIIEVIIMSAVMIAMMMGFMSLMNHETKNVTYLEDNLSRVALESELRMRLSQPDFCKDLLAGTVAPSKNQTRDITHSFNKKVQKEALNEILHKNAKGHITYDKLKINGISMEDSNLTSPKTTGILSLIFQPERLRKGGGPPSLRPVKIEIMVSVDDTYKILSCRSESEGERFGGFYQTYACGPKDCRIPNPLTGYCTCAEGYRARHFSDFNAPVDAPCGKQIAYENKGMILYVCLKNEHP